jgi:sterol desaturase/sphingolipid hydroxylase (fatty acid hydroxylase superfamily)
MHMTSRLPSSCFPVLLLAPPGAVGVLAALGMSPALALTLAVLVLIAVLAGLEQVLPFRKDWQSTARGETATDVVYIALASVPDRLTRVVIEAAAVAVIGLSASASTDGEPLVQTVGLALLAFVLADLGKYLIHRASHSLPGLWRFHLAHHQPSRLSALNALRLHPVNMAYNAAIDTVPMLLFGVSPAIAAVIAALRATVGVVQHANLDLEAGRQWLVNAPSYHRNHHDVDVNAANHNFASTLLVWDRLFGTLSRAPAPTLVGVAPTSHRLPVGYLGQTLYPWCGDRLDTSCVLARFRWLVR